MLLKKSKIFRDSGVPGGLEVVVGAGEGKVGGGRFGEFRKIRKGYFRSRQRLMEVF